MAYGIDIDYNEVREVARQFDNRALEVERAITEASGRIASLLADWDGVASEAFDGQTAVCLRRMRAIPPQLRDIAADLRYAADEIERAEQRAKAAFEEQERRARGY
jgi:WXG100 family type VII secretion target